MQWFHWFGRNWLYQMTARGARPGQFLHLLVTHPVEGVVDIVVVEELNGVIQFAGETVFYGAESLGHEFDDIFSGCAHSPANPGVAQGLSKIRPRPEIATVHHRKELWRGLPNGSQLSRIIDVAGAGYHDVRFARSFN